MADGEDIQPLVCDNGTGMVKVKDWHSLISMIFGCIIIVGNFSIYVNLV